ncbi:unnamed protein product [Didymodactylos carnosus]|uniref:HAT C-terminal dimerisation domain-containing protein n=1 Tax=Didymodactylos carnosus TaxID=1234261 RepID=A0A816CVS2_9BILA|nr:unnamed protein product [Didymodactylos carnosus]CAF1626774.1 unnamed protein product [Didymodactylos carnosus]CAF4272241.1 unnamed protein product [Didymodactylos carnosus]CAF4521501.1 unnamed protein product [Didymodactylos carnosus]
MDVASDAQEEDGDQQILDENGIDETKVENGEDSDDEFEDDGSIFDEWGEGVIADDTCALTDQTLVIQLLQKCRIFVNKIKKASSSATKFWKTYSNQLPVLSKVARKYLATPGTSVPSESAFSTSAYLARKQRPRLTPDSLAVSVFLKDKIED